MITSTTTPFDDVVESLTGFEELEIAKRFGDEILVLLETRATIAGRALIFVETLRALRGEDVKAPEAKAYEHAMGLTIGQVGEFFPDAVEEPIPDEPKTPAGEGDSSAD